MKSIWVFALLPLLCSCGVNLVLRVGLDVDPSLDKLVTDVRQIADEMGDKYDAAQ